MTTVPGPVVFAGIDELEASLGVELGPTPWVAMEQPRIDTFADCTEDHQWIHVDPERGAAGPFGATVAHGFLTLSLVPHFIAQLRRVDGLLMGVNYGLEKVRFPAPVRAGSRIRARATMTGFGRLAPNSAQLITTTTVEVDGSAKPACVCELVARYTFAG